MRVERPPGPLDARLDVAEARLEATIRAARALLGIDAEMACEVREREQHVAELLGHARLIARRDRLVELAMLLDDFLTLSARCRPLEICSPRALAVHHCAHHRMPPVRDIDDTCTIS